jgi:2-polyprenyl-3-methyl-5-hydroxy-6-metoxy-1,4-benzoquinol methylase
LPEESVVFGVNNMNVTKQAYGNYYKGMTTGIGGNERFIWLNDVLLKNTTNKKILDVGCGEGSLLKMLKEKGNVVMGIDASASGKAACAEKCIECDVVDISRENFESCADHSFDIVLCLETIEHVENPHHCLCEIKRILKENGLFIVSIPNDISLHPYVYPGLFGFKNFSKFLGLFSFEIIGIKGWGQTAMFTASARYLESKNNSLTNNMAAFIKYLERKINCFMRNHVGTPLSLSACWNFICVSRKMSRTPVEMVAEVTDQHISDE